MLQAVTSQENIQTKFKVLFKVTKDLQSVRRKGVMQEDIVRGVNTFCEEDGDFGQLSQFVYRSYHSLLEAVEWIEVTEKRADDTYRVGIYASVARMGIPTFLVGVQTQEDWVVIREYLRNHNLVR